MSLEDMVNLDPTLNNTPVTLITKDLIQDITTVKTVKRISDEIDNYPSPNWDVVGFDLMAKPNCIIKLNNSFDWLCYMEELEFEGD